MAPLATAVISLIKFYWLLASTKLRAFLGFVKHRANLFEHAPRGFVGDARLPLNLLRGDAATGLRHEVDRVEPNGKRRGRLVEDSASGRVNVMAAMVARVRRTAHNAMMLGDRFALHAIDTIRVKI